MTQGNLQTRRPLFMGKVTVQSVLDALDAHVKPGQQAVILVDRFGPAKGVPHDPRIRAVIDVQGESPSSLDRLDAGDVIIYACTQDDLGLPFVERLHATARRYYPVWCARPGGYVFANSTARAALEQEFEHQHRADFGKWDFGSRDFENLIQAVEITKHLPGCYLEVGCYRGSSAGVVLRYLAAKRRAMQTFFLDVFDGFNYDQARASADAVWEGTHVTDGLEVVRERLSSYNAGFPDLRITVDRLNIITDPLPASVLEQGIAVANLDVDLHEAVRSGLHAIAPHIVSGGILVVEDPGHTPLLIGAHLALQQFLAEDIGRAFTALAMESGQTFLIRK
jgi:hypothetical protein